MIENQENGINKGRVALKEEQPLHKIPLWFPNEINLHCEGNNVVPYEHHRCHDCWDLEHHNWFSNDRIYLQNSAGVIRSAKYNTGRKLGCTITNLITDNVGIKEANCSSLSRSIALNYSWVVHKRQSRLSRGKEWNEGNRSHAKIHWNKGVSQHVGHIDNIITLHMWMFDVPLVLRVWLSNFQCLNRDWAYVYPPKQCWDFNVTISASHLWQQFA